MPAQPPSRLLLPLLAGLALGASGAWAWRRFHGPAVASANISAQLGATSSATSTAHAVLIVPPVLDDAEADAALAAYLALPPLPAKAAAAEISARSARLRALLTILPTSHFERLLSSLAARPGSAEADLRLAAFSAWTERDAPAAAPWALAIVPGEGIDSKTRSRYAADAALTWAANAFDDAYAWANSISETALRDDIARRLLAQLASTDPARAIALARAAGDGFFKTAQTSIFESWARIDPAAAIRSLGAEIYRTELKSTVFHDAFAKWFARDSHTAFAWVLAQPVDDTEPGRRLLLSLSFTLGRDPSCARSAAAMLCAHPEAPDQSFALRMLTNAWAEKDPRSVLAWIDGLPDAGQRAALAESTIKYGATELAIDDIVAFARRLPESQNRNELLYRHFNNWLLRDSDQALAWLSAHETPEFAPILAHVQGQLIARLAETDSAAALAKWQTLPLSTEKTAAAGSLAVAWARSDPAAATRWLGAQLASLPRGVDAHGIDQTTQAAFRQVATRLAQADPTAVLEYAATVTAPDLRQVLYDSVVSDIYGGSAYYGSLNFFDQAARADRIAGFPDETVRTPVLSQLLGDWLRDDFRAARAWIENHEVVSPELAARLLSKAEPVAP